MLGLQIIELEPRGKLKSTFSVHFREGIFVDRNELIINEESVISFNGSLLALNDIIDFMFQDKPYQFRYTYTWWTGKPRSFIVIQNNRVIAQYGDDSTLKLKPNMRASKH